MTATKDNDRMRGVKNSMYIAAMLEGIAKSKWVTARQVADTYRRNVGEISDRTIYRYLLALETVGVAEAKSINAKRGVHRQFKFGQWPMPFDA